MYGDLAEGTYEARYLFPANTSWKGPAGFRRAKDRAIQLGQQARIDFSLKVGTVQETMEVDAGSSPANGERHYRGVATRAHRVCRSTAGALMILPCSPRGYRLQP
jgi:hypothetical protein